MACIPNRVAVSGWSYRQQQVGAGLEGGHPSGKALVFGLCLGNSFSGGHSMPSCMEIIQCAIRLSWLFLRCLFSSGLNHGKMLSGSPQPYWRQKKIGVQTPGPWWTRSLLLWALLPAILGALPSTTMSSEKPAFRTECRERVGLRTGYQEKESRQTKPSRRTYSESILASFAGLPTRGS